MSTFKLLEDHIKDNGGFTGEIHEIIEEAINTIPGRVPKKLKLAIALSELITFVSHLRINIKLFDGTLVPINAITFGLAGSGVSKDKSLNSIRSALSKGYEKLNIYRKENAKQAAKDKCFKEEGTYDNWLDYYNAPKELLPGLGSPEGLVAHFKSLEEGGIGAGVIQSSEIGNELMNNPNILDIISLGSIAYDLGKIPAKVIKDKENRISTINKLPVNMLFFGSQDAILYDTNMKAKFKLAFSTQLARRSIFSYSPEILPPPEYKSIKELQEVEQKERMQTLEAKEKISELAVYLIDNIDNLHDIELTEDAQLLYDVYLNYNDIKSNSMPVHYPISKLSRKHKQWLTLKIAGAFAILQGDNTLQASTYISAINIVELLAEDLIEFERELVKDTYEVFTELCKYNAEDGIYKIDIHVLKKLGYIRSLTNYKADIKALVTFASNFDKEGIYTECENGICYEEIRKKELIGISYLETKGDKKQRGYQVAEYGLNYIEVEFEELSNLLKEDYTYSNFRFKDNKRDKDSIIGGTSLLVLDIDKSAITDEECHILLSDINHHIARTSDPDNPFKFRLLIQLDAEVDLSSIEWKKFLETIAKNLGLEIDILPKSSIFYAYKGRNVLSVTNSSPLETRDFVIESKTVTENSKPKKISEKEKNQLLDNPLETFFYAFDARDGEGSTSLVRAGLHAYDLGATKEYILNLIDRINDYWTIPMEEHRIKTIKAYLTRRLF